tara:strand:+ start:2534 stop:2896 length:363 start_codon:yes stop_codon:yes gene_type:complete
MHYKSIQESSKGSIVLFWKDTLLGGVPHDDDNCTYQGYKQQADNYIVDALRSNKNVKDIIQQTIYALNVYMKAKKNNKNLYYYDRQIMVCCIFTLIKLKIYEEDDLILIADKYKKQSRIE